MACKNCKDTSKVSVFSVTPDEYCAKPCQSGNPVDSTCVYYTDENLPCSGIDTNDSLSDSLKKIDEKLCAASGDYSTYNTNCLSEEYTITDEASFVESITDKVCKNSDAIDTINNTTIPDLKEEIEEEISTINLPALNFSQIGVIPTDNIKGVLSKYGTSITEILTNLSMSGVNWSNCFTVGSVPTNLTQAFNLVLSQICSINSGGGTGSSITFDNTTSCLPAPVTTSDSLYSTVEKIKTRLCTSPVFDLSLVSFGTCFGIQTSFQSLIQQLITKSNTFQQNQINATDGNFSLDYVDSLNPCLGKKLSLSSSLANNKVASTASDTTPGTLQDKLVAGTNIGLDYTTQPGKTIINSTGSDGKIVISDSDNQPGYIVDKIESEVVDGISLSFSYNSTNHKLTVTPSINPTALFTSLLNQLDLDSTLGELFCSKVNACTTSASCHTPESIQAIQVS